MYRVTISNWRELMVFKLISWPFWPSYEITVSFVCSIAPFSLYHACNDNDLCDCAAIMLLRAQRSKGQPIYEYKSLWMANACQLRMFFPALAVIRTFVLIYICIDSLTRATAGCLSDLDLHPLEYFRVGLKETNQSVDPVSCTSCFAYAKTYFKPPTLGQPGCIIDQ